MPKHYLSLSLLYFASDAAEDAASGDTYYFNTQTQETTWDRPEWTPEQLREKQREFALAAREYELNQRKAAREAAEQEQSQVASSANTQAPSEGNMPSRRAPAHESEVNRMWDHVGTR